MLFSRDTCGPGFDAVPRTSQVVIGPAGPGVEGGWSQVSVGAVVFVGEALNR